MAATKFEKIGAYKVGTTTSPLSYVSSGFSTSSGIASSITLVGAGLLDSSGTAIAEQVIIGIRFSRGDSEDYVANFLVPAGNISSDGKTLTNCKLMKLDGDDLTDTDTSDINIPKDSIVEIVISPQQLNLISNWINGTINSGSAYIKVGTGTSAVTGIKAGQGFATDAKLEFAADGLSVLFHDKNGSSITLGAGSGSISAGDGIDVTASVISADIAASNDLLKITSGEIDTNLIATKTELDQLAGTTNIAEADTFFGATDFSSDDANAAGSFISDYTAKEDISAREVVAYVPASSSATIVDHESETGTSRSIGGASPIVGAAIRVTLPDLINRITSIKLMLSKSTATVGTIIVKGFPTTTDMNNSTNEMFSETIDVADIASSPTYELETITFGTPLEVTLKKTFYIRIEGSGTDGSVLLSATGSGSGVYFDNDITTRNYTSTSQTPAYSVQGYLDTAGIVKGDASDATRARVIGLAVAAITSGNTGAVQTQGLMSGFSLAESFVGNEIYLSDTEGAIVTTPGTVERKIGNAISTSKIIINT